MWTKARALARRQFSNGTRATITLLKRVELFLFVFGLISVPVLVSRIGAGETFELASRLGPWLVPLVVLGIVPHVLDTLGLFFCLPLDRERLGLAYTFAGRLAGEGVNAVLPTATVGGELIKVSILGRRAPLDRVTAGVTLTYAIDAFTTMVLTSLALPLALPRLALPLSLRLGLAALVLTGLVGTYVFLNLVRGGLLARIDGTLRRLGLLRERLGAAPGVTVVAPRAVAASALLLLASTLWGAVEVGVVRYALTGESLVGDSLAIASLASFLDALFFFVPGQIGTREGGLAGITSLAGLGPSLGITIALVRRMTQMAWALVGYGFFAWLQRYGTVASPFEPRLIQSRPRPIAAEAAAVELLG